MKHWTVSRAVMEHGPHPRVDPNFLHSELTDKIIPAFYRVYDTLGFGFLESVY